MSRSTRMFEIIQLLRSADKPLTAQVIAHALEVTTRTVYRDIAVLQSMRVPIEGEAGIGYVMRPGFDLPPLMFSVEEVEAIVVGLALIKRTGDRALLTAAERAGGKIADVLPDGSATKLAAWPLYTSDWSPISDSQIAPEIFRKSVREEEKLHIVYADASGSQSERTVLPLAVIYYIESIVVAAWCELREDFRHFRVDRITECAATGETFSKEAKALRQRWQDIHKIH